MWTQYRGVKKTITSYWSFYGGKKAILTSPYFAASVVLTILTFLFSGKDLRSFSTLAIATVPSILGFTLGGYALMYSFGDNRFLGILAGKRSNEKGKESILVSQASYYLHFLLVQIVTFLFAVFFEATGVKCGILNFFGYIMYYYAILLIASAAFLIFKNARRFDRFITIHQSQKKNNDNSS